MGRRRSLSDEERALWSGVARSVAPLRGARKSAAPPEPADQEAAAAADQADTSSSSAALSHTPAAKEAPPLAPLGRRLKQRVARGREPIDARLDLHGLTQTEAHAALLRFLRRAQADGAKIALVVTGKGSGRGSDERRRDAAGERGVLRRRVPMWLSLPEFRSFVVGFEDAHAGHGGEGALYVRLRRAR
jgi:DNA-nicking Smr family endonuclease